MQHRFNLTSVVNFVYISTILNNFDLIQIWENISSKKNIYGKIFVYKIVIIIIIIEEFDLVFY